MDAYRLGTSGPRIHARASVWVSRTEQCLLICRDTQVMEKAGPSRPLLRKTMWGPCVPSCGKWFGLRPTAAQSACLSQQRLQWQCDGYIFMHMSAHRRCAVFVARSVSKRLLIELRVVQVTAMYVGFSSSFATAVDMLELHKE